MSCEPFQADLSALLDGDRITVIGRPEGISTLRDRYGGTA